MRLMYETVRQVDANIGVYLSSRFITPLTFRDILPLSLGTLLKGHCIEFIYYADGIHSGLTPPGNNS